MKPDRMNEKLSKLEAECTLLYSKLTNQRNYQEEISSLKQELEGAYSKQNKLQELAVAFETENRLIHEKYALHLKDQVSLDTLKNELEKEIEAKTQSYISLERKFLAVQDKVETQEEHESQLHSLEKENRKLKEKIQETKEELEASNRCFELQVKQADETANKFIKENEELNLKLETYIEEMEEMDLKVESLENENMKLKKQSSKQADLHELENQIEEVMTKLKKETLRRENVENELFKIEEEYEHFKRSSRKKEKEHSSTIKSLIDEQKKFIKDADFNSDDLRVLLHEKHVLVEKLQQENSALEGKLKTMTQEHGILLDENSSLARANATADEKIDSENSRLTKMREEVERLTEEKEGLENGTGLAKQREDWERKEAQMRQEIEDFKGEFRKANDKTMEMKRDSEKNRTALNTTIAKLEKQNEESLEKLAKLTRENIDQKERSVRLERENQDQNSTINMLEVMKQGHEKSIRDLRGASEMKFKRMSLDINNLDKTNAMMSNAVINFDRQREQYENRISELTSHINELEQRLLLTNHQNGVNHRGNNSNNPRVEIPSPETTPPVPLRNGKMHDSMEHLDIPGSNGIDNRDSRILDETDTLSEREFRRIAYKITEGSWDRLPGDLRLSAEETSAILHSSAKEQEKAYNVLVAWREKIGFARGAQLTVLVDAFEGYKRKDVVKFLREMGAVLSHHKEGAKGIKKQFSKLKRTVKR